MMVRTARFSRVANAAFDMFLNVVASLVPMAILQLVVLPLLAREVSVNAYGSILASVSLLGLIPLTAGNVINNVRLLRESNYIRAGCQGDFSFIAVSACAISSVAVCVGSYVIGITACVDLVMVGLASSFMLLREYLVVEFRLRLNYRGILFSNLWQTVGHVAGFALFVVLGSWGAIYMIGYLASVIYLVRSTTIWRDPIVTTPIMHETLKDIVSLGAANILSRATNYVDRLVLVPLAGAASVSIYYVACLFGKVLSLIVNPINNVLLSYLAKEDHASRKGFWIALASGGSLCIVGYIATMLVSRPLIALLYPQYVDDAMMFVPVATAAAYVMVLSNVANPFVMRFCDLRWQTALNAVFCASFFLGSIVGYFIEGLLGFCFGVLLANCVRLALVVVVYLTKSRAAGV